MGDVDLIDPLSKKHLRRGKRERRAVLLSPNYPSGSPDSGSCGTAVYVRSNVNGPYDASNARKQCEWRVLSKIQQSDQYFAQLLLVSDRHIDRKVHERSVCTKPAILRKVDKMMMKFSGPGSVIGDRNVGLGRRFDRDEAWVLP